MPDENRETPRASISCRNLDSANATACGKLTPNLCKTRSHTCKTISTKHLLAATITPDQQALASEDTASASCKGTRGLEHSIPSWLPARPPRPLGPYRNPSRRWATKAAYAGVFRYSSI